MSRRGLSSRFDAMGISSPRNQYDEGRLYDQHRRMAPQSQPPPMQTPPQHQQQAMPPQPLPPLPTSGSAGPRPLPPLVAPLGSNDRPMFPDARQNEISSGGGGGGGGGMPLSSTAGAPPSRRRPMPPSPSSSHPHSYHHHHQQQQYPPQHLQSSQPQPPSPSPRGAFATESYNGALAPYEENYGGERSQFALSRPSVYPYETERIDRQVAPFDDHHRQQYGADGHVPSHRHRAQPSPRSGYYEDEAHVDHRYQQNRGNNYHYYDTKQNYAGQPYSHEDEQYRPAPSPRSRRRSSVEDFRDDVDDRFQMERRRRPPPSSPAGCSGLASPRGRSQPQTQSRNGGYYNNDGDDDIDEYHRRIDFCPSVESDISIKSAASSRQSRSHRSRAVLPQSPRHYDDNDAYEIDYAPSRRDRLRSPAVPAPRRNSSSRVPSAYNSGRKRMQDPYIMEEEEDLYDVEVHYPSILKRSPRQPHDDLGRRVTFSPSTELPDEDSYASQRSIGSRSTASASVAHGVITSPLPGSRTTISGTKRMQEESGARQQIVAEIRQAMEMRDSARDFKDVEFWERQIKTLKRALQRLGSKSGSFTGSSDAYSGGRDLLASSSWQSEETSSRASAISGRSSSIIRVRAPTDLPGGREFTAMVHGSEIRATVPRGGVRKGETFSVHPEEDDFDLAEISSSLQTVKNIKVRAPSNLNEGHQLTLRRGGETIVATVPRGGVHAGEVFAVCVSR